MMTEPHIFQAFDRDLEAVQALIMKMGGMVEAAILDAAQALETRDEELAEQVRRNDAAIDALEERIQAEAARLIALRSPTATDLRTVLTVIKIAAALERCGDYAKNSPNARSFWVSWRRWATRRARSGAWPMRSSCCSRMRSTATFTAMPSSPRTCASATARWIRCTMPCSASSLPT